MTTALAAALDAFYLEHRRCGEIDSAVQVVTSGEWQVWFRYQVPGEDDEVG
jgi:hypothetical protein